MKSKKHATLEGFLEDCHAFIANTDEHKQIVDSAYLKVAGFVEDEITKVENKLLNISSTMDYCASVEIELKYKLLDELSLTVTAKNNRKFDGTLWSGEFVLEHEGKIIDFSMNRVTRSKLSALRKIMIYDLSQFVFVGGSMGTGLRRNMHGGPMRRRMSYNDIKSFILEESKQRNMRRLLTEFCPEEIEYEYPLDEELGINVVEID